MIARAGRLVVVSSLILLPAGSRAEASPHGHPEPVVLAPGYADLEFEAPAAGSYLLPPLGSAADGEVLRVDGSQARLGEMFGDKMVVLSFIFTTCGDINGCPLATYVLKEVQDRVLDTADLKDEIRIVSLSFDPGYDTPAVMRAYGDRFVKGGFDWEFLTCQSEQTLAPILEDYDQWVIKDYDAQGNYLGTMSHVLRVYLIDRERRIRNIYSVSFLHADTLLNDIRTILMEEESDGLL